MTEPARRGAHRASRSRSRRCGWCGVLLRWWQLNFCRGCSRGIGWVTEGSRRYELPDDWPRRR